MIEYHQPECQPIESLHHHDGVEVGYCESGSGVFFIDGQNLPSPPCVTVLYPGQLHKAYSTGTEKSRWVFITFRPEAVFPRNSPATSQLPWKNAAAESALSTATEMTLGEALAEECRRAEAGRDDCLRGLLAALLIRHGRLPRQEAESREKSLSALERLRPVLQYIDQHYTEELRGSWPGRCLSILPPCGIGSGQESGRADPHAVCSSGSNLGGLLLLRGTGRPITEVAEDVGYRSLSSFNRHFQEICGLSPTDYRRG